jgi:cyanophycinase-like exopeptidase
LQRGRLARLLQAVKELPTSHIGVGLDNATAAVIEDGASVYDVTGLTAAAVVDLDSYGAAGASSYPVGILSLRNGALHLLPPGDNSYDLDSQTPTLGGNPVAAPDLAGRNLDFVAGPDNSALFIAGDLTADTAGPVVQAFAALASAQQGQTLVVGLGDPNGSGQSLASNWKEPLRRAGIRRVEAVSLTPGMSQKALDAVKRQVQNAGALMIVSDQQEYVAELIDELAYVELVGRWTAGVPVLLDNGAAAAAGQWMSANPMPTSDELEDQGSESFLLSGSPYVVEVRAGLGMILGAAFEPRALVDYRYGRLASLIHADNDLVTFGIDQATALLITDEGAVALGDNGVLVVDGRYAELGEGTNDAIAAAWLLVDTYAPGETLE